MGGGGIKTLWFLSSYIAIFPFKSTKHGFKWKLTSLPYCREFDHLSMLNSLVVRWRRSSLIWPLSFGTTIFENLSFFTYMGNIYIKWKLKTFQIWIWHKKIQFLMKNLQKIEFSRFLPQFRWDFFFCNANFSENFIYTPQFFFIHVFYRWQRKITWRLDTPNLITRRMASDRMTVVLIPPPTPRVFYG